MVAISDTHLVESGFHRAESSFLPGSGLVKVSQRNNTDQMCIHIERDLFYLWDHVGWQV